MKQLAKTRTFVKDVTPFSQPKGAPIVPLRWSGAKRFERVLLVFPDYKGGHFGALRPPAGLGFLAQILEEHDVEYDVLDMAVGSGENDLIEKIRTFRPGLVGFSMMSFMYHRTYELFRLVKRTDPTIVTIAGGPHISCVREVALEECDAIDYGVVKEGEGPLMDLVFGRDPGEIGGLIHRDGEAITFNGERPYERIFDVFPWPRYNKFPLGRYITEEIGIETSRGCPQQCTFCPVIPSIGRKLRRRTPESVLEEIGYWHERGYRQLSMLDDNFSVERDHAISVCKSIQARGFEGLELNCNNGIRADRVDPEMLAEMVGAGFRYFAFGVEGGNDRVLEVMKKGETLADIERAVEMAIDVGIKVTLFFIVGNPGETAADVEDTKRLALKYPVFDTRFYNMIPFPGSELYDWVKENGYFIKDPKNYLNHSSQWDFDPVFETPEFSAAERRRCLYDVRKVRKTVRYRAMKRELTRRLGMLATPIAKIYVNDLFQDLLMKNAFLRRNLKRVYMYVTSTGGNAISVATIRGD